jgi:hypothetical protein
MPNRVILAVVGISLVVGVILILVAGRREDVGAANRAEARYLGALGYLFLFVGLLASFDMVLSLMDLVVDRPFHSDNANYREATTAGLVAIVALVIFVWHARRSETLAAEGVYEADAPSRVLRAAMYVVCFTAAVIVLISVPYAVYGIFRIIGPGVYGSGAHKVTRQVGIRDLVAFGYLALLAVLIFVTAWRRVTPARSAVAPPVATS